MGVLTPCLGFGLQKTKCIRVDKTRLATTWPLLSCLNDIGACKLFYFCLKMYIIKSLSKKELKDIAIIKGLPSL